MTRPYRTCAHCSKFPLEASLASGGRGWCPSYERERIYNAPATVLFVEAKDVKQREAWIAQLMQQQPQEEKTWNASLTPSSL